MDPQSPAPGPLISIRLLSFAFGAGSRYIFRKFSLELGDESPVAILGASGCGKTTLLRLIAGLLKPLEGELEILRGSPDRSLVPSRDRSPVSFVFQEPRLLPWMNVLENTALPIQGLLGRREGEDRARHFLELVGLADKAGSRPAELSGGQRQRAGLARAFAYPSPALLLDEPFQSLDIPLRIQLMDLTLRLLEESPRLTVLVTHDPREAVYVGRRILALGRKPGGDPCGILFDETLNLSREDRAYGSAAQGAMEKRLLAALAEGAVPG
ncbi:MAG: ABC transporter ATP-binding protein [Treponema sp.]|jgi:NitT/TauT family transport system ATP-binding protein|nr:ABC transporter ATP-binding protein [Treponema sp.]